MFSLNGCENRKQFTFSSLTWWTKTHKNVIKAPHDLASFKNNKLSRTLKRVTILRKMYEAATECVWVCVCAHYYTNNVLSFFPFLFCFDFLWNIMDAERKGERHDVKKNQIFLKMNRKWMESSLRFLNISWPIRNLLRRPRWLYSSLFKKAFHYFKKKICKTSENQWNR